MSSLAIQEAGLRATTLGAPSIESRTPDAPAEPSQSPRPDGVEFSHDIPNCGACQAGSAHPKDDAQKIQAIAREVAELARRDREVRAHEQAHLAAAGGIAAYGPSYEYTTGPDGKRYAVAGEVHIDTSPVAGNPEATIQKARTVQAAANAPANPSSQDRAVASAAAQMEAQARLELLQRQTLERAYGASPVSGGSEPSGETLQLFA